MKSEIEKYLFNSTVDRIIVVLIGAIIIWFATKAIQKYLYKKTKDNESRYRTKKVTNFIGYFLIFILLAFVFWQKLGNFTIALGVAGAGIAFALQEVISSFAGWLGIMFGGFYKPGDRVQLGGIKGDVMDIGVLRTTIMEIGQWIDSDQYNGRIVLVANSFVFKEPVFNYSSDCTFLWDEIKIPIQFGSDIEKTKQILLRAGQEVAGDLSKKSKEQWHKLQNEYRLEEAQTESMVSLVANEAWLEFTLRYVVNYKKRRATKTELFTRILKEIQESNGEIKYAALSLNMGVTPMLNK